MKMRPMRSSATCRWVDTKIAAPVENPSFYPSRAALTQHLLHEVQRGSLPLRGFDCGDDPPTNGAHGKDSDWSELAGAQLQLAGRQGIVRLDVCEQERRSIRCSFKRQVQEMPDSAMGAIAADDEPSAEFQTLVSLLQHHAHVIVVLKRRNK